MCRPYSANEVYVTGTFDDWGKSEKLDKVDGGFEKEVQLPDADQKIYYKFVVDDQWIVDNQAPKEDDGHYNVNNVLLPHQIKKNAPTVSAGGQGAPLLTKEQSEANLARRVPHVTPDPNRPVIRSLSQNDGAAESRPEEPEQLEEEIPGAFPQTPANEPSSFSVTPIPASGHQNTQSSVTTSKEDYESAGGEGMAAGASSSQPVNADIAKEHAAGPGNTETGFSSQPINADLGKGAGADDAQVSVNPLPATGHENIQSSVTTSKEDYEKAGAFGMAGAAIAGGGAALANAFLKPKGDDKNVIPESSLPMNPEKTDTTDTGPFMSSAGPGTTTAELASQVPLEPKREAEVVDPSAQEALETSKQPSVMPFVGSSGPGTTTADLASQVPYEQERQRTMLDDDVVAEKSDLEKELLQKVPESQATGEPASAAKSQIPIELQREGVTADEEIVTEKSDLERELLQKVPESQATGEPASAAKSQIPIELQREGVTADEEIVAEKSDLEKELLQKVPTSQATGEPASAAQAQTSHYGLASNVPQSVEDSIAEAHASPEAATERSAVAEKSVMERELQVHVPVAESAGEPAPTLSASLAATAPGESSTAATTVDDLTGGMTANEPVPDTDTSTQDRGLAAGEMAGGVAVGGAAAASAFALASRHEDKDIEPSRLDDSRKPPVTSEAAPATIFDTTEPVPNTTAGVGSHSPHPGVNPMAGAALSDGTEDPTVGDESFVSGSKAPAETSEATATEYAPPRTEGMAPGVSPSAAAALSDGCEDPTMSEQPELSQEPAVRMMAQNEAADIAPTSSALGTTTTAAPAPELSQEPAVRMMSQNEAADIAPTSSALGTTTSAAPAPEVSTATEPAAFYDAATLPVTTSSEPASDAASRDATLLPTVGSPVTESAVPSSAATTRGQTVPSTSTPVDTTTAPISTLGDTTSATTSAPIETTAAPTSTLGDTTSATTSAPIETTTPKTTEGHLTPAAAETTTAREREASSATERDPSPMTRPAGESSAAGETMQTPKKSESRPAAGGHTPSSVSSTPSQSGEGEKKKKNRLSRMFKKIFE